MRKGDVLECQDPTTMARQRQDLSGEESDFDLDEDYFARTYQPLSNLPTPPPSSRASSATEGPQSLLEDGESLDPVLLGPAVHLVNLLPPAASLAAPSVPLVHAILTRAALPLDTIALAVCILDSLDHKFSLNWRLVCPLAASGVAPVASKRHSIPATSVRSSQLHIDSVHPELIILAALVIAFKFLEDCHEPTQYYGSKWGRNLWSCEQINATERTIMESLRYRILPLWDEELIGDAVSDMARAGRHASGQPRETVRAGLDGGEDHHKRSMSSGKAVAGLGLQLTPVETPVRETRNPLPARGLVGDDVRAALGGASMGISPKPLHLLSEGKKDQAALVDGLPG